MWRAGRSEEINGATLWGEIEQFGGSERVRKRWGFQRGIEKVGDGVGI